MFKKLFNLIKFVWSHPLNRNHRLTAMRRVLYWQIISRIKDGPIILPFVNGTHILATRSMIGATGDWYCGLREYQDMGFLLHFLKPGDIFVDIGANIGSYSILAGSCEGVNVIAYEPIPATFNWLQKNISHNQLSKQIKIKNIGLADNKGTLKFSSNLDILNHVIINNIEQHPSIEINVEKLDDDLVDTFPTVIKIDVEGYELQVLNGAKKIINNSSLIAVIIEINGGGIRYGKRDHEIHKLLISKGFESFEYDPFNHQLNSLEGKYNSISNTLYLRNIDEVQHRISRKKTFKLGTGHTI